jgi:hypothetical protein
MRCESAGRKETPSMEDTLILIRCRHRLPLSISTPYLQWHKLYSVQQNKTLDQVSLILITVVCFRIQLRETNAAYRKLKKYWGTCSEHSHTVFHGRIRIGYERSRKLGVSKACFSLVSPITSTNPCGDFTWLCTLHPPQGW